LAYFSYDPDKKMLVAVAFDNSTPVKPRTPE
jgi:hypothetical protein